MISMSEVSLVRLASTLLCVCMLEEESRAASPIGQSFLLTSANNSDFIRFLNAWFIGINAPSEPKTMLSRYYAEDVILCKGFFSHSLAVQWKSESTTGHQLEVQSLGTEVNSSFAFEMHRCLEQWNYRIWSQPASDETERKRQLTM